MHHSPHLPQLIIFAVVWAIGIYIFDCLHAHKLKRPDIRQTILHISAMALLGVVGETAIGNFYHHWFHSPLWQYQVYPVHDGYTSQYALFLWGIYGFHLYLLHGRMKRKHKTPSVHRIAFWFCLEAIVIELLVNITFKLCFGQYIFYYYPTDLWHLTSVQTLPFYFVAGYIIVATFKRFEVDARFFTPMSVALAWVIVFAP